MREMNRTFLVLCGSRVIVSGRKEHKVVRGIVKA